MSAPEVPPDHGMVVGLGAHELGQAFPFHFAFNRSLAVVQAGDVLQRVVPAFAPGARLQDIVTFDMPFEETTFDLLASLVGRHLVARTHTSLVLRGQLARPDGGDVLVFLGSPWFTDAEAMRDAGVSLQDFAPHEAIGDLMVLLQSQRTALADAREFAERLRTQRAHLSVQYDVTRILSEPAPVDQVFTQLLERMGTFFGADVAAIWLRDGDRLACRGIWALEEPRLDAFVASTRTRHFAHGEGLPGRVWQSGEAAWVDDVTRDPNFPRAALAVECGLHGGFAFPVRQGSEVTGVIEAFRTVRGAPHTAVLELLALIGLQLGQYLARRGLESEREQLRTFYEQVLNALPAQLAVYELDGQISYLTPSAVSEAETRTWLLGRMEHEYGALRGWDPAIVEARCAARRRAITSRGMSSYEETLPADDGIARHYLRVHSPIIGPDGTVAKVLGYGLDITETHQARLELAQARQNEIATGAKLQEMFLGGQPPEELASYDVSGYSQPSKGIDGDFLDFFRPGPALLDVVVGDPMGKGIPAALLGAATKSRILRALLAVQDEQGRVAAPAEVIAEVHRGMAQQLVELGSFVTLCYLRFNFAEGHVRLVDSGHPPAMHLGPIGSPPTPLRGDDLPLGFPGGGAYADRPVPFAPGDAFVMYSDGLVEARGPGGERFGYARLQQLLGTLRTRGAATITAEILRAVQEFTGGTPTDDDLTLAVVRIPRSTALREGTGTLELPAILGALPQVRELVWELRDQITGPGEATRWAEDLAVAVIEVFTNIVRHEGEGAGPVRCTVRHTNGHITIRLSHRGDGFIPGDVPLPDIVALPTGGFGLHLIRASVDEARWEPDADGRAGVTLVTSTSRTPATIPSNTDDMA